jgi:hypothetical protein
MNLNVDPNKGSAQDRFSRLLRVDIALALRKFGFSGTTRFRMPIGEFKASISPLKARGNSKDKVEFTFELSVTGLQTGETTWADRLGPLLPDLSDQWWVITDQRSVQEIRKRCR